MLKADPAIESRRFGIVDVQGRSAGFSGANNAPASLDLQGNVPGHKIFFSIQRNILANVDVVHAAVRAFREARGRLADRVMAAREAPTGRVETNDVLARPRQRWPRPATARRLT